MKKRFAVTKIILLLLVCSLPLSGCGAAVNAVDLMDGIEPKTGVNNVDITGYGATAATDFAVRLLQNCTDGNENAVISPVSVLMAMAMTANGADGETLSQMESVFGMNMDELNEYLRAYMQSLPQGDKYKLDIANSIWFRDSDNFSADESFLQANADFYNAGAFKAPFDNSTLRDINRWVEDNTDGMIKDILSDISEDAVMYLVNAVAFDAEWQNIYYETDVREGVFTCADGSAKTADFMYSDEYAYIEDEMAAGFMKYYSDGKYAFAALLPDEGVVMEDYIASLTGEKINKMLSESSETGYTVHASIPKFECEYSSEMSGVLSNMGMTDAFDLADADFSRLGTADDNIYINRVLHKAFIEVGEKGTRAGAATVVEMDNGAAAFEDESTIKTVHLDRPFVYMIIDCESMIPAFIGVTVSAGR